LKGYADVPVDTPDNYQKMKDTLSQYEKELESFSNEYTRCDTQYTEAQDTLKDRLDKWKKDVNKNFSKVMQMLQLDGELNFEDLDGQGAFGLNFNVANSVGGAKSLIEKSNFSGGEKQRTNIAFIVAIIIQTQYTYLIWDEPDSAIGEPYREMLAKVIENFFPYRKLILASPQRIVQGYIKVFDQIIEVYKDGKNQSHITKVLLTDEYRKDKGVLDVKSTQKV
jgi:chromosome segregation ATPase